MGDEPSEEQGHDSGVASDQSQYADTQPQDTSGGADPSAAGGDGQQGGQAQHLDDSLFNRLGGLYSQGQYDEAINTVKPLVDSQQGDPNWGRAAYGLIMCYDMSSQFAEAQRYMQMLVDQLGSHPNREHYQAQLDGYARREHWTGDFLLY
jgi:hypothetical protein